MKNLLTVISFVFLCGAHADPITLTAGFEVGVGREASKIGAFDLAQLDSGRGLVVSAGFVKERRSRTNHEGWIYVWDLGTGRIVRDFHMPARVYCMAIDRRRHLLAVAGGPGNRDNTSPFRAIYDYMNGQLVWKEENLNLKSPVIGTMSCDENSGEFELTWKDMTNSQYPSGGEVLLVQNGKVIKRKWNYRIL